MVNFGSNGPMKLVIDMLSDSVNQRFQENLARVGSAELVEHTDQRSQNSVQPASRIMKHCGSGHLLYFRLAGAEV